MKKLYKILMSAMLLVVLTSSVAFATQVKTVVNKSIVSGDYSVTTNSTGHMITNIPSNWSITGGTFVDNSATTSTGGTCNWSIGFWDGTVKNQTFKMNDKDYSIGSALPNLKYIDIAVGGYWTTITFTGTRPVTSWKIDTTVTLTNAKPSVKINGAAVTKAGSYTESLKSYSGGDSIVNWTVKSNVTAVENVNVNTLKVYPNPVINELRVSNITGENIVTLFDMSGKIVLKSVISNDAAVDVSVLKEGMYIVKVGSYTTKILKR
jgi:hypothetical protein